MTSVTVWSEYRQARDDPEVREHYPDGINVAIAEGLDERGFETRTAKLDDPQHGLSEEVLDETDVLFWWSHRAHDEVDDEVVDRVHRRVLDGMGLVPLHSSHYAKIFKRLMGTSCSLKVREVGERERLWVVEPGHPIVEGLDEHFEIPREEMYGERFDIPSPDELVFVSWFEGGEVFRSGCCYTRGKGRVFYFRPGHETYPIYYQDEVRRVLANAAEWAAPTDGPDPHFGGHDPLEDIE